MSIFKKNDNSFYFIHIPRTGGRYLRSLFKDSEIVECNYKSQSHYDGIDSFHLNYPLYEKYLDVKNIPHITIVRDPFYKFSSCMNVIMNSREVPYPDNFLSSYELFLNYINNQLNNLSKHNNWFLPQYKFISPKTKIWKYEWGFDNDFKEWLYKITNINLTIAPSSYEKFESEVNGAKYVFNDAIKDFVKSFYKKDYETFDYS